VWAYGETNSSEDGVFTLGTLQTTPTANVINYTEDRSNSQITICGNLTDMNSESSVDCSIQYFNEESQVFNETSTTTLSSTDIFCKTINLDYGHDYTYRTKCDATTTGYSEAYENEFMALQPFFAGNVIEDDMDYLDRQYCPAGPGIEPCYEQRGYREGSLQEEDYIWIESNITDKGTLTVHWWNGSQFDTHTMTKDGDSDMNYLLLSGLGNAWQTFYITGTADEVVLNWTKPSLTHLSGQNRTDESKYVSFSGTPTTIDYQLLYMDEQRYNNSAYRWCVDAGGSFYDCMAVEYWGGGVESGIPASLAGTSYDRGQLFRGGVINGEMHDTGILTETRESNQTIGSYYDENYCFAFTNFFWDMSIVPTNNITNYYFRYWSKDELYSEYLGHNQDRLFDMRYLSRFEYDQFSLTRDWVALDNSTMYDEAIVKNVAGTEFNTTMSQSLMAALVTGVDVETDNDLIYSLSFYTDGRWTNQQHGKYQQAFVIFNLPDNATLLGLDSDSDGLNDYDELFVYYLNPKSSDTDEDGRADGWEINRSYDPNLPLSSHQISTLSIDYVDRPVVANITYYNNDNDAGTIYAQWSVNDVNVFNETINNVLDGETKTVELNESYYEMYDDIILNVYAEAFGYSSANYSANFTLENSCTYIGIGKWVIQISDNCVIGNQTIDDEIAVVGTDGTLTINGDVVARKLSFEPSTFAGNFVIAILNGFNFGVYK